MSPLRLTGTILDVATLQPGAAGNHAGPGVRSHGAHERSRCEGRQGFARAGKRGGSCTAAREKTRRYMRTWEIGTTAPVGGERFAAGRICNDGYQVQGSEVAGGLERRVRPMRERRRVGLTRFQRDGSCARSRRPVTRRVGVPGGVRSHTGSRAGYKTPKDG